MPSDPVPAEISVIIINYGTADLAVAAVESVLSRLDAGDRVDVHLVDNASPGDDRLRLQAAMAGPGWAERVRFYPETVNHGFARGNNLVLRALAARPVPPRWVFFLNPDAQLANETLPLLVGRLDADRRAGFAGAGIDQPGTGPVVAAFRFPTLISEFANAVAFGPVSRMLRRWRVPLPPDHPEGPVDWVAGAGVLARMDALQAVDFFDPGFFLYYEEVDLMRRARAAGWHCLYVPEARVVHAEGAATGVKSGTQRRRRPAYWYRSWARYFRKRGGRAGAMAVLAAVLIGTIFNRLLSLLRRRPPAGALCAARDYLRIAGYAVLFGKDHRHDQGL